MELKTLAEIDKHVVDIEEIPLDETELNIAANKQINGDTYYWTHHAAVTVEDLRVEAIKWIKALDKVNDIETTEDKYENVGGLDVGCNYVMDDYSNIENEAMIKLIKHLFNITNVDLK